MASPYFFPVAIKIESPRLYQHHVYRYRYIRCQQRSRDASPASYHRQSARRPFAITTARCRGSPRMEGAQSRRPRHGTRPGKNGAAVHRSRMDRGAFSPPETHSQAHKRALAISDELISELLQADELILDTPMYNHAVPAVLKAWIDHVVRAGKTFRYTSAGPEGLLAGKNIKAVVIIASGGKYTGDPRMAALDF